jgi:moderate conductance mechanosensitive channel
MPSFFSHWSQFTLANALHLAGILIAALMLNSVLRTLTNLVIKVASSPSVAAQMREQQTRTLAGILYSAGSKVVWGVALLTCMKEFNIDVRPAVTLAGLASVALGFGAQNLIRDVITGIYIIAENQFVVGDTIQVADQTGRVEHITLRRTVIRDARGALTTIANGEIRVVSNLSRDWSQAFVDVSLAPETSLDAALQSLEKAAADLRNDPAWKQALVDGPRVLGLQQLDRAASTVRLQVRTAPTHQDDVSRELRRRIQMEFQRQGIPLSSVQRLELVNPVAPSQDAVRQEQPS